MCALVAVLLLPAAAAARKPIISYVEGGKLKLFDAQAGKNLGALPVTIADPNTFRYAISLNGRYVFFNDAAKKLHLLDRKSGKQIPLPGIDVYMNPGFLSVSNFGRLAFDNNANGPGVVYESARKAFVPTGFAAINGHRQTKLSGGGNFLATTCMADCIVDLGPDSNPYLQDLRTGTDLGIPDDNAKDEEHPCISGNSRLIGWDKGAAVQKDVFIYDRIAASFLNLPNLNDVLDADTNCVLDSAGDYVGFQREGDATMKLYQRSSSSLLPLPAKINPPDNNASAPFSVPKCGGRFVTVIGSEGRDVIRGGKHADVIAGLEGNDRLIGGKGKDVICGGKGKDKLIGGKGRDKLVGGKGKDREIQ